MASGVQKGALGAAIALVLAALAVVEGGYVNDPRDPGSETNHGITKRVAVDNGYSGPMRQLPKAVAEDIYVREYIEKPGFLPVIALDTAVGEELVDSGVNTGPARPARWFQIALNALNNDGRDYPDVTVDGKIGPRTVAAYQALQRRRGPVLACQLVLRLMDAQQAVYYLSLTNLETFIVGWVRTRIRNVDEGRCGKLVS